MPCFARIRPNMQYFPNNWSMQGFFNSGIGPDILMNFLTNCIIFLIWAAWILFNFYLKQKQIFSKEFNWKWVLHFLPCRNLMYIFKIKCVWNKQTFFWNVTKIHQETQVSKATSIIRRLFASLDLHYNDNLNTEVQKQNET